MDIARSMDSRLLVDLFLTVYHVAFKNYIDSQRWKYWLLTTFQTYNTNMFLNNESAKWLRILSQAAYKREKNPIIKNFRETSNVRTHSFDLRNTCAKTACYCYNTYMYIYKHAAKRIYVHNTVFCVVLLTGRCSGKNKTQQKTTTSMYGLSLVEKVSDSGPKNGGHSRAGRVNGRSFGRAFAVRLPRFGGGTSVFGQPIYWFAPVPHPTAADATVGRTVVRAVLLKPDFIQYCI